MISDQISAPGAAETAETPTQYLTFSLRDEVFAMDIRRVREIIQYSSMTAVPQMPEFVRGVINLRGAVVPVIDLHSRFGRGRSDIGKKTCIIIFDGSREGEKLELGLMVDAVSEVIDISQSMIEAAPHFGASITRDYIHGMGKVGAKFVVILDPDRALDIEDMATLVEQAQGA
jgi:purine-binding chemotaxis protein CheW